MSPKGSNHTGGGEGKEGDDGGQTRRQRQEMAAHLAKLLQRIPTSQEIALNLTANNQTEHAIYLRVVSCQQHET